MNQVIGILIAFFVFSFIVFFHEFGHFIVARKNGIGVEEFAIGMGPKLWSIKRGETVYSIRLLPIGGFCAMLGEDDAGGGLSSKPSEENGEEQDISSNPKAFNNRPLKARFLAILAGPGFNFILAFIFAIILILVTGNVKTKVINEVNENYPAYAAGIRSGDKLIAVNHHRILDSLEAATYINIEQGKPVDVQVNRQGKKMNFKITPKETELPNGRKIYQIGIGYEDVNPNIFQVFYYAIIKLISMIKMTFFSLFALISGMVSLKMMSGPIGIVNELSQNYKTGITIAQFIAIFSSQVVLLSANLGIMNLLPIPALDGGRLAFLTVEAVRGKPLDAKKEGYIHLVGFVLLMLLMVFVFYSDIMKLIVKK